MLAAIFALCPSVFVVGCSSSSDAANGSPSTCTVDADCGDHAYCSAAKVCRTDCFTDVECYGPSTDVQCTSHGQCIETGNDGAVLDDGLGDATDEAPVDDGDAGDETSAEAGP